VLDFAQSRESARLFHHFGIDFIVRILGQSGKRGFILFRLFNRGLGLRLHEIAFAVIVLLGFLVLLQELAIADCVTSCVAITTLLCQ
jgi:hypothetical protein